MSGGTGFDAIEDYFNTQFAGGDRNSKKSLRTHELASN